MTTVFYYLKNGKRQMPVDLSRFAQRFNELYKDLVISVFMCLELHQVETICFDNLALQADYITDCNGLLWKLLYQRDYSNLIPSIEELDQWSLRGRLRYCYSIYKASVPLTAILHASELGHETQLEKLLEDYTDDEFDFKLCKDYFTLSINRNNLPSLVISPFPRNIYYYITILSIYYGHLHLVKLLEEWDQFKFTNRQSLNFCIQSLSNNFHVFCYLHQKLWEDYFDQNSTASQQTILISISELWKLAYKHDRVDIVIYYDQCDLPELDELIYSRENRFLQIITDNPTSIKCLKYLLDQEYLNNHEMSQLLSSLVIHANRAQLPTITSLPYSALSIVTTLPYSSTSIINHKCSYLEVIDLLLEYLDLDQVENFRQILNDSLCSPEILTGFLIRKPSSINLIEGIPFEGRSIPYLYKLCKILQQYHYQFDIYDLHKFLGHTCHQNVPDDDEDDYNNCHVYEDPQILDILSIILSSIRLQDHTFNVTAEENRVGKHSNKEHNESHNESNNRSHNESYTESNKTNTIDSIEDGANQSNSDHLIFEALSNMKCPGSCFLLAFKIGFRPSIDIILRIIKQHDYNILFVLLHHCQHLPDNNKEIIINTIKADDHLSSIYDFASIISPK